jgi:hypothetical protein
MGPRGDRLRRRRGPAAILPQCRPIPGTKKTLCTLAAHNGTSYGPPAVIDPTCGTNDPEGILNLAVEAIADD